MPDCCKATPDEVAEIKKLHTRKAALRELVFALAKMSPAERAEMYECLVTDLAETSYRYDLWWTEMAAKHGLQGEQSVNFETGEFTAKG